MAEIFCSLCRLMKEAQPLDMDDPLFSSYVRIMRKLGKSRHSGALGICPGCMPAYTKMESGFRKNVILYGALGLIFAIAYSIFTGAILLSLLIGLFFFSLALFSYCPPLKR